ncbi:MAG: amidohydrolase [Acidobacteria bacterium]|nr:amidohydrolase [Acidobacteriota bacterium]
MDVVDAHLHLFKSVSDEYPRDVFEGMTPPEREERVEDFLEAMDAAGVDRAIVVPLSKHDRYLGDILRADPGKFVGIGVFDVEDDDPIPQIIRRADSIGMQGFRFYGFNGQPGSDPSSLAAFPALEVMQERGLKVWFYGSPVQVALLDGVMELLPDLKVVLNHLGFCPDMEMELTIDEDRRPRFTIPLPPDSLELIEKVAAKHSNLYIHVAGQYAFTNTPYPYPDIQEVVSRVYAAFGADRMLMASDWPWIQSNPGYEQVIALVDHYLPNLSTDERDAVRGGTAMSLFHF